MFKKVFNETHGHKIDVAIVDVIWKIYSKREFCTLFQKQAFTEMSINLSSFFLFLLSFFVIISNLKEYFLRGLYSSESDCH